MSLSRTFAGASFCPWCGTRTLEADRPLRRQDKGAEYTCRLCGRGFKIGTSHRYEQAVALFKAHRRARP